MAKGLRSRETLALLKGPFVSRFYVAVTSRKEERVLTPEIAERKKQRKF